MVPLVFVVLPHFFLVFRSAESIPANLIVIAIWLFGIVRLRRGRERYSSCLVAAVLWVALGWNFFRVIEFVSEQYIWYANGAIPVVCNMETHIGLFQSEYNRLPFDKDEAGTVTTWRKTNDGQYEPIQFAFGGDETNVLSTASNVFSRLDMPVSEFSRNRLTPDQVYVVCLTPGGVSEDGATTNAYAYAVGVFGSGKDGELPSGTGYAVLAVFFPDVHAMKDEKRKDERVEGANIQFSHDESNGLKFVAEWNGFLWSDVGMTPIRFNFFGRSRVAKGSVIRFGPDPEPGVCTLIPPETFAPGAVTNLLGRDDSGAVEYWVERLRSAPCGKWEIPELR